MIFSRPPLSYVPAAPALAGVVSAIAVAPLICVPYSIVLGCVVACLGLLAAFYRYRWAARFLILFAIAILSTVWHSSYRMPFKEFDTPVRLNGEVTECRSSASGSCVRVALTDGYDVELYVRGHRAFCCGDSVACTAKLSCPSAPRWPAQTDYAAFLERKGIAATAMVAADSVFVTGYSKSVVWKLRRVRDSLADCLRRSSLSDGATSFLIATLLGDSSSVDVEMRQRFSSVGVAHLLALSGTHVAVVSLMIAFVLFPLYLAGGRRLMLVVTVVFLWGYAFLTGLSPSVVRAVIMATLVAGAYLLSRPLTAFNSLLVAAILILLFDPAALLSVSFQLSFVAVAGILMVNRIVVTRCHLLLRYRAAAFIFTMIVVTVAATLFTAPLTVMYFGVFPVYFLLANIPAMILIVPILAGGSAIIVLELFHCGSSFLCRIVDFIYNILDGIINMVGSLPRHVVTGIDISLFTAVAWICFSVGLLLVLWRPRSWVVRSVPVVAMLLLIGGCIRDVCIHRNLPDEEVFIINDSRYAGLLYRSGSRAWILTPEPPAIARTLCSRAARVHKKYLSLYSVDSLRIAPSEFVTRNIFRHGPVVAFRSDTMMFLNNDTLMVPDNVSMILLCRGTTRRSLPELKGCNADSVIVMPGVHWRVARSVADSVSDKEVFSHDHTIVYRCSR